MVPGIRARNCWEKRKNHRHFIGELKFVAVNVQFYQSMKTKILIFITSPFYMDTPPPLLPPCHADLVEDLQNFGGKRVETFVNEVQEELLGLFVAQVEPELLFHLCYYPVRVATWIVA